MESSSTTTATEIEPNGSSIDRILQGSDVFNTLDDLNVPRLQDGDTVHLVWSDATLLSLESDQDMAECKDASDSSCIAGMATVAAYARKYSGGQPTTIIPHLDYQSAFVQMHPLQWNINRVVFEQILKAHRFFVSPWLFSDARQDLDFLRSHEFHPVISNIIPVGTDNLWYPYIDTVYFDVQTSLAVLTVDQANQPGTATDSAAAISGLLTYIAAENRASGCNGALTPYEAYQKSEYGTYDSSKKSGRCWVPVIVYEERTDSQSLLDFVDKMAAQEFPPAVIVDVKGNNAKEWSQPMRLNNGIWVVSYELSGVTYVHQQITVNGQGQVSAVRLITADMEVIDPIVRANDTQFSQDIAFMHSLAAQAAANDPVLGHSGFMPLIRTDDDMDYRKCMGGECPGGDLFSNALRWYGEADIAFISSGGVRGPGWEAGEVKVSDIWTMLPFPNTACTGVMSGLSIFRLVDYSTREATFESTYTALGDRLLQVSGMRYTYNTQLPANETTSRIVAIDIWDEATKSYQPVDRLKLYKFATDSWLCSGFDPFPSLLSDQLVVDGEEAGVIDTVLHQQIVGDYLRMLEKQGIVYDTSIQGRLVNNTDATVPLALFQTSEDCAPGSHWMETKLTCVQCPDTAKIIFAQKTIAFEGDSGSTKIFSGQAEMINGEAYPITVQLKSSPSWINFTGTGESGSVLGERLGPGGVQSWGFTATAADLEAGTASASVSFVVRLEGEEFPNCFGNDATFDVFMRVSPEPKLNKPGSIRAVGLTLMGLAVCCSVFFGLWVVRHRQKRIVKAMQPQFLTTICFGVLVISLSIIPLSIEDDIAKQSGRDMACMATPWLLSMGFTIAILSLYAKLWRINQVFNGQQFRRVTITSKSVTAFCGVLATINFTVLLLWTLLDPLRWVVKHVEKEPWNQYGTCVTKGATGMTLLSLTVLFNVVALLIACHQAYKAKDISDEYSESKHLGIALFGWVEIVLVGFPVLFLIQQDNTNAKYFLEVILISCISLSMLLIIFLPIMMHFKAHQRRTSSVTPKRSKVQISGVDMPDRFSASYHSSNGPTEQPPTSRTASSGTDYSPSGMDYSPERYRSEEFTVTRLRQLDIVEEEQSVGANSV
jgi:7 transmembrane sweet-taste receptor of 3 GCPR/5'-nucleotidase, C-terminal domain